MCHFLKLSKSTYYFNLKKKENKIKNNIYDEAVISAFKKNKEVYGTRRLKVILENQEIYLSRRKIKEIMNKHNLISKYTKLSFKNLEWQPFLGLFFGRHLFLIINWS
ncbi:IS3 family transposase [Spiroplasma endosymbiont of Apeira syringaria]|uniref:IS3 family transposase n=1 Tax=Spiroplasma endosymbiont of Apeira syringaria TaxID=3066307 RepID=UPI0030D38473